MLTSMDLNVFVALLFFLKIRDSQRHAAFVLRLNRDRRLLIPIVCKRWPQSRPWDGAGLTDHDRLCRISGIKEKTPKRRNSGRVAKLCLSPCVCVLCVRRQAREKFRASA
jgi:hypothetical protein